MHGLTKGLWLFPGGLGLEPGGGGRENAKGKEWTEKQGGGKQHTNTAPPRLPWSPSPHQLGSVFAKSSKRFEYEGLHNFPVSRISLALRCWLLLHVSVNSKCKARLVVGSR